jgi:hypothetical protein
MSTKHPLKIFRKPLESVIFFIIIFSFFSIFPHFLNLNEFELMVSKAQSLTLMQNEKKNEDKHERRNKKSTCTSY